MQNKIVKFRVWDEDNLVMYYSDKVQDNGEGTIEWVCDSKGIHFEEPTPVPWCDPIGIEYQTPNQILQKYTGLKDPNRNNAEVYQGDIYTWGVLTFPITIDDYHGYRFMFGKDQLVRAFIINGEYKGNIHETPEGPKGKEDG